MKLKAIIATTCLGLGSTQAAISAWETASQAITGQVTTNTNGGAGYALTGSAIAHDYGDLDNNGDDRNIGAGAAIEYIFNLSDTGGSIVIGGVVGWDSVETYNFKLEQYNNKGIFGVTSAGVIDADYTGVSSIFNTDTHVVFVNRPDNKMELYVNGVSQGVSTRNGSWITNGDIGALGGNGGDAATGTILGVASYNTAITSADVTTLYNAWATPVPEPSSTALLGLGGLALILRRHK